MNKMFQVIMVERLRNNTKRERERRKISSCENQNNKLHSVLDTTHCVSFPFKFDIGSLA